MRTELYNELIRELSSNPIIFADDIRDDDIRVLLQQVRENQLLQWEDFELLDGLLKKEINRPSVYPVFVEPITAAIVDVVGKLTPSTKVRHTMSEYERKTRHPDCDLYSNSNLMHVADNVGVSVTTSYRTRGGLGSLGESFRARGIVSASRGSIPARQNAARALRIILEKIGEQLPDEAEIIRRLLNSDLDKVRHEGSLLAFNTASHKWKDRIDQIGLVDRFFKESDVSIRANVVGALGEVGDELIKEGSPLYFLKDLRVQKEVVVLTGSANEAISHNALCLLSLISRSPSQIEEQVEDTLLTKARDSNTERREISMKGLINISERRIIKDTRFLPLILEIVRDEQEVPEARSRAFVALGNHLGKIGSIDQGMDRLVLNGINSGIRSKDLLVHGNALFALANKVKISTVQDPELVPLLLTYARSSGDEATRQNALAILNEILNKEDIRQPSDLKTVLRANFNHEHAHVRQNAIYAFGNKLCWEEQIKLEPNDVDVLLNIAETDLHEPAQHAATFALAVIVNKDLSQIPPDKYDRIEVLCRTNRLANDDAQYRQTLSSAVEVLAKCFASKKAEILENDPDGSLQRLFDRDALLVNNLESLAKKCSQVEKCLEETKKGLSELKRKNVELDYQLREEKRLRQNLEAELTQLAEELKRALQGTSDNAVAEVAVQSVVRTFEHVFQNNGAIDTSSLVKDVISNTGLYAVLKPFVRSTLASAGSGLLGTLLASL